MRLINSIKIAITNSSLAFKSILYKAVIFLIFSLIIGLFLKIRLAPLLLQTGDLIKDFKGIIDAMDNFPAFKDNLETHLSGLENYLSTNVGGLVLTGILVVVLFLLYKFFSGISDCTMMILANEYMSTLSQRGFIAVMLENLKQILKYQLANAVLSLLYSVVVIGVVYGLMAGLGWISTPLCLFACVLCFILLITVYYTFMSQVMSNIVVGKTSLKDGFKAGLISEKNYFWKMFKAYLIMHVFFFYLTVSTSVFTFGVGTLIVSPCFAVVFACMRQVDYFTIRKMKYYVDYDTIIVPKELREHDETLLNKIDI